MPRMQVLEHTPEQSMLQAPDGAPVQVRSSTGSNYGSAIVEVVGHVQADPTGR